MPFNADTRCIPIRHSFNVNYIAELLEDILEMEYCGSEKHFWAYVEELERQYDSVATVILETQYDSVYDIKFNTWFIDNYNNVRIYDIMVEKCFKKENELD